MINTTGGASSDAEEPYLFDPGHSQVGAGPPQHRFADGSCYFVYKFEPPQPTQTLTLSVTMWNELGPPIILCGVDN